MDPPTSDLSLPQLVDSDMTPRRDIADPSAASAASGTEDTWTSSTQAPPDVGMNTAKSNTDNSTDNTKEFIEDFSTRSDILRYLKKIEKFCEDADDSFDELKVLVSTDQPSDSECVFDLSLVEHTIGKLTETGNVDALAPYPGNAQRQDTH